jgi:predicted nucleic acid-binding protein
MADAQNSKQRHDSIEPIHRGARDLEIPESILVEPFIRRQRSWESDELKRPVSVVSNTSPIVNAARIDQLELIQQLYDTIAIPEAVYDEIVERGAGQPGSKEVQEKGWIQVRSLGNRTLVSSLEVQLDRGEAEAIALAVEIRAQLVLVDEKKGRRIAEQFGLKCIGLSGVLLEAKASGLVVAVKPILDRLLIEAGFRLGKKVYDDTSQKAGV